MAPTITNVRSKRALGVTHAGQALLGDSSMHTSGREEGGTREANACSVSTESLNNFELYSYLGTVKSRVTRGESLRLAHMVKHPTTYSES